MAVARDLASDTKYPGFAEAGKLLLQANSRDGAINDRISPLITNQSIGIALPTNLVREKGALATLTYEVDGIVIAAAVKDKRTDEQKQTVLVRSVNPAEFHVSIDGNLMGAPDAAKRLLVVKEVSHLLLIEEHKKAIAAEVLQNFDVTLSNPAYNLENVLWSSSHYKSDGGKIMSLGDLYDNGKLDLDSTGYYYIMRAFGKMKANGAFSSGDLMVLESDDQAFEAARRRGYLIDQGEGNFVWKEGITAFSREWRDIGRAVLNDEYYKLA